MDSRRELAEAEWERLGTRSERWMIVAIVVLSVTTLVAPGVFFYRYRPTGPHMTPPEELGGHIQSLGDNAAKLELDVGDRLHRLYERTEQLVELGFRHSEQVGSLAETFMTLQKAIDVRDDENKKLKLGYDAQIFGRFLRRFIRVDRAIQDYLDDPSGETENLLLVKRLLEDALDECGVEPFEPEVGEDYRAMGDQVADNPKDIPTTDPDQDFQVAEIVERGYRLRGADDSWQIVVPAKVRIYKYQH
jgi:molecular chaperone GrpE (heat shock protein)